MEATPKTEQNIAEASNGAELAATDPRVLPAEVRTPLGSKPTALIVQAAQGGATWFYWIAGLTLLNSAAVALEWNVTMMMGLGVTQIADAISHDSLSHNSSPVTILRVLHGVLLLGALGFFLLMGARAKAFRLWAFQMGMVAYAADGVIFYVVEDWVSVGFHAFVLFMLWGGYKNAKILVAALTDEQLDGLHCVS